MPEGDTLHRTAARLGSVLEGARVVRFDAPRLRGDRPRGEVKVEGVEARGKNLLVHFDDGLTLRTHLRMTGSWYVYRSGERWRESPGKARVVIEVDNGWLAVCFAAPVVETYRRGGPEPAPLARLGPDLCRDDVDLDAVVGRWSSLAAADDEVGVLLLDQRIAAGIGNVYRSEILFANALDPSTPAAALDPAAVRRLYTTAHRMLRANLTTTRRRTIGLPPTGARSAPASPPVAEGVAAVSLVPADPVRPPAPPPERPGVEGPGAVPDSPVAGGSAGVSTGPSDPAVGVSGDMPRAEGTAGMPGSSGAARGGRGAGLAVYGRAGRPCLRCGTPVRRRKQGEQARSVYWCPKCQGVAVS